MVESSKCKTERIHINNSKNKVKQTWEYNRSTDNYGKETTGSKSSWPPRPYTCSFCKREFRSAQALGGHMNVHRRDRATLNNQSIPWDINLQHANFIIPNPNNRHPSISTTFTSHHFPPAYPPTIAYSLPSTSSIITPPSITACSSSAPPSTDGNTRNKSFSSIFVSSSSFSQSSSSRGAENVKKSTSTTLPMMETSFEILGDQHDQLKGFMNDNDNHYYCGNNNMQNIHGEIVRLDLEIGLCSEEDLDLELRLGFS
ncbi:hypothetical protein C5167_031836 [Papaver somniferum]|uniref:C2H2-type domain-containing protein n=1 Tax=Papaver somniferum TaxID=3469 RepID=A0A4Y7K9K6_PAPSO|nr:hypothetical protein C5167_031836 [Papaver somniferum]